MRLDSALKKVVPNISRPKQSRHFLMKLPDNFQIREHSWPCRFHINKDCIILSRVTVIRKYAILYILNRLSTDSITVLVVYWLSFLFSSAVDHGFASLWGQTKDFLIDICCFYAKHAA